MADHVDVDALAYRLDAVGRGFLHGLAFIPLHGKRPTLPGWNSGDKPDCDTVFRWARAGNIGVRTGRVSGIVAIDADHGADTSVLDLPVTPTSITGGSGRHFLFLAPDEPTRNSVKELGPSIDFRGDGGQIVFPGSIHPDTGAMYRWEPGRALGEIPLAELPVSILEKVRREPHRDRVAKPRRTKQASTSSHYGRAALAREANLVRTTPDGERNNTLNRASFNLGQLVAGGELLRDEVAIELLEATTLPQPEAVATIRSGIDAGAEYPRSASGSSTDSDSDDNDPTPRCTDLGNGQRLARRHGHDLRYSYPLKSWFVWNGQRWNQDSTGEIERRAKDSVRCIYDELITIDDADERSRLAKWAIRSQHIQRVVASITAARSEPGVPVLPHNFDRNPWLINLENGTIDLRTQELRAHRRHELITKMLPVAFDASARCDAWIRFLSDCANGRREIVDYLQRVVGYCLTGDTSEQCFFILHGDGANGKSVFLNVIRRLLGDYAEQTPKTTFVARSKEGATNDLAKLRGARLVSISETEDGEHLAESLIKQVTGQDPLTARPLYKEFFTFVPQFKVLLATNYRPQIRGTDFAIWRRIRLIPFDNRIAPERQDHQLTGKLIDELPGILAWAVRGCRQWLESGLKDPPVVMGATAEYRRSEDRLSAFFDERCVIEDAATVTALDVFNAYLAWCRDSGEESVSQKTFGAELRRRGFQRGRTSSNHVRWTGLRLRCEGDLWD